MNLVSYLHQAERISEGCLFDGKGQGARSKGQVASTIAPCNLQLAPCPLHPTSSIRPEGKAVELSDHAQLRAKQRGLSEDDIVYVLHFGQRIYAAGALICYLRRIDIPESHRKDRLRLEGTAVFVAIHSQRVITVWRNRLHGTRNLHRKLAQVWRHEKFD